jgi:hypothetical protein
MLGYTEMEFGGMKILSKNVLVSTKTVKIPVNITVVISEGGPCTLTQSRASIMPGILYYSKTSGLNKSIEDTIQQCIRKLFLTSPVADRSDDAFFEKVRPLLQVVPSLPPEKISTLVVLVVTSKEILFTNKLGTHQTLPYCLLVPTKGTNVLVIDPPHLEAWLKILEEAVNLRCSFPKLPV